MKSTLFGTDGIRAHVGSFPLTPTDIPILGHAIGLWITKKCTYIPHILLSDDTRKSCVPIKTLLKRGLLYVPLVVHDSGTLPTPAVCAIVKNEQTFDAGLVLSASHNPYEDNGIKIVAGCGSKIEYDDQQIITDMFFMLLAQKNIDFSFHPLSKSLPFYDGHKRYINHIKQFFKPQFLQQKTIVLDCANGATHAIAPLVFELFGAHVLTINNVPNGTNINAHCGTQHPKAISVATAQHSADIGFAFDGDGDRVAVATTDGTLIDGDFLIAILMSHPDFSKEKTIVGTILSNHGLSLFCKERQRQFIRACVGDLSVLKLLKQHNALLGGEPNGHIIIRSYLNSSDGIFTALKIAEAMILADDWYKEPFALMPQMSINVPIQKQYDLNMEPFTTIINTHRSYLANGRIIVRYSGTQKLLRIMLEDQDNAQMNAVARSLAQSLAKELE